MKIHFEPLCVTEKTIEVGYALSAQGRGPQMPSPHQGSGGGAGTRPQEHTSTCPLPGAGVSPSSARGDPADSATCPHTSSAPSAAPTPLSPAFAYITAHGVTG